MTSRGTAGKRRLFHRDNLIDWCDNEKAVDEKANTITDPRTLVPYRGRCYGAIVEALMTRLKASQVKGLTAKLTKDASRILSWSGVKKSDINGVAATPWIRGDKLFDIACKLDPELAKSLKSRQSNRPGVDDGNRVKEPVEKFINNAETIQRTGGITPYAMPLMICEYAIDSRYVAVKGEPVIEFRLVIGRSKPQVSGLRAFKAEKA